MNKIPPQAIEIEKAVLGAILLEKHAIDRVLDVFDESAVFYEPKHIILFDAILDMRRRYQPVDMLTLLEYLRAKQTIDDIGGAYYLVELTREVTSAAHIEDHARILYEKYMLREVIKAGGQMVTEAWAADADAFSVLDDAENKLLHVTKKISKTEVRSINHSVGDVVNRVAAIASGNASGMGITTGFRKLDEMNNGWSPTDLVIIAARPAVGKTAFALNLAYNAAKTGVPVGIFSLEMGASQLVERMISHDSKIFMEKLKTGGMGPYDMEAFTTSAERVGNLPIFIDDNASLKAMELRSKCRKLVDKHGVRLVIVDYIQLMEGDSSKGNANREQELSKISRQLKVLAKELNITVIALSQLSRSVEQRADKTPQLSDLRESGAIEQDADEVYFLYRPSEGAIAADASLRNVGYVKSAKDRDGAIGDVVLSCDMRTQTWADLNAMQQLPAGGNFRQLPQERDDEWNASDLV